MNHKDLIKTLADELDLTQDETDGLVREFIELMSEKLENGEAITIPDLGTFSTKIRKPKKVYNPHYDDYLITPEKRVTVFSPASPLKDELKFKRPSNE